MRRSGNGQVILVAGAMVVGADGYSSGDREQLSVVWDDLSLLDGISQVAGSKAENKVW